ncbi:exodeoxyribonuclease V subunit alpha [Fodinibius sp. AD559]|uniref:exodeoxyribonuclease V subunit alpha n=1 Tax=Fodinibius sp. AD559 TaxID=3424179 RepID=UPI004046D689
MDNTIQKLDQLRQKEIIRPIDLELCRFLKERHSNISPKILIAACLVSHLYQQGHVCLPLDEYAGEPIFDDERVETTLKAPALDPWRLALAECSAVGKPGDYKPLILDDGDRLYMHKLWHYERTLAKELIERSRRQDDNIDESLLRDGLSRLFSDSSQKQDWQQVAAATSIRNNLSIISGGPGTGKTSTVVRVLALILEQYQDRDKKLHIALAAPTGKAAARLQDSIISAKEGLDVSKEIREAIPEKAQTLHQLLGARRYSSEFKYNADNPIPYDLVVVDEASMVDQALMSKLVEALLDDTRLLLLGDKDQLASVEAGSVLGDICDMDGNQFSENYTDWLNTLSLNISDEFVVDDPRSLTDNITLLTKSYRFSSDSGIARLSKEINDGNVDRTLSLLESTDIEDAIFESIVDSGELESVLEQKIPKYFQDILESENPREAVEKFNQFGILAAHRKGPWGIVHLNKLVEDILQDHSIIPKYAQWYPGKPVIINTNDYTLELFNGDTGVCFPDQNGDLKIFFKNEGEVRGIMPSRLPTHNTAYALTVHKSQGSEFYEVMLVLPRTISKVVNRELLYTAITRARTKITIMGEKPTLRKGIQKKIRRSSGLKDYLWS